jgi:hypothetical protein
MVIHRDSNLGCLGLMGWIYCGISFSTVFWSLPASAQVSSQASPAWEESTPAQALGVGSLIRLGAPLDFVGSEGRPLWFRNGRVIGSGEEAPSGGSAAALCRVDLKGARRSIPSDASFRVVASAQPHNPVFHTEGSRQWVLVSDGGQVLAMSCRGAPDSLGFLSVPTLVDLQNTFGRGFSIERITTQDEPSPEARAVRRLIENIEQSAQAWIHWAESSLDSAWGASEAN